MISILSFQDSERRFNCINQLAKQKYVFKEPVNLNNLQTFNTKKAYDHYRKHISSANQSCTLSHLAMAQDTSSFLILEDDFQIIHEDFFQKLPLYIKELNKISQPTVLIIGHSKVYAENIKFQRLKQPLINKRLLLGDMIGENYRINFYGTVGYLINEAFKENARLINEAYWLPDDWHLISKVFGCQIFHFRNLKIIENQNFSLGSSINNKLHCRHNFQKKPLSNLLKIIRIQLLFFIAPKSFSQK